jgi:DNA helicase II / ATP-dependent DNA helicase PcrA
MAEPNQHVLTEGLTNRQESAVRSNSRLLLVVAGAGSGKTDVMARRIAWWVGVDGVPKEQIVAFTFTERAAEEMKFRIRQFIELVTPPGEDATLGDMYVGTIHGYCLKLLRDLAPDDYHNFDVLEEGARVALVQRGYHYLLGLNGLADELSVGRQWPMGQFATISYFLKAYDLLNEYDELEVKLPPETPPHRAGSEADWCKQAKLITKVGRDPTARAFAISAARFYAYLRCRRFLDFSTSQSEVLRLLRREPDTLARLRQQVRRLVVDEIQDVNPVQRKLIDAIVGDDGHLTGVGDHRQAIFAWRGGRIDIMAELFEELDDEHNRDGEVVELTHNFRSTPRIIGIANDWASTISPVRSMTSPDMEHGRETRTDAHGSHIASIAFATREEEADWIAKTINKLVDPKAGTGTTHDTPDGDRGLTYGDIAVLTRSGTDARTYMTALEAAGIPAIFRGGDLFSQPEVLLLIAVLSLMAGLDRYMGNRPKSLAKRIQTTLGCEAEPQAVLMAAAAAVRAAGLPLPGDTEERLALAGELVQRRHQRQPVTAAEASRLQTRELRDYVRRDGKPRRVFPQAIFHFALAESGVAGWDGAHRRSESAMFHLGTLSSLVRGMETPGWTDPTDFHYQMIALCTWGAESARTEEAPLLVQPDTVTISTVHSAKGLEFAAVFLADVCAQRFPSNQAKTAPQLPFTGPLARRIDPTLLADNTNLDGERRLMYVGLTRAERYLFMTCSGTRRSQFQRAVEELVVNAGGLAAGSGRGIPKGIVPKPSRAKRDIRLVTSFSDLRYYLECPHDFYLRKVLGFAPTIDQAFGYGRGVHNLLRAVHSDPGNWAQLAHEDGKLEEALNQLVGRGLMYLRYTVGDPQQRMEHRAVEIVADYVRTYADELATLHFEPEREFETLIEEEQVLVSGVIDIVRHDDPPRVSLVDFKSGEPDSDTSTRLDSDEMRLQVSLYGVAAKKELEYKPDQGIVRYLAERDPARRELVVPLDDEALTAARAIVAETARAIRDRRFHEGPTGRPRDTKLKSRCGECDFLLFCGHEAGADYRAG